MAVPRHRHTHAKVGKTRMHKNIKRVVLNTCSKCGKPALSHTVCPNCGYYKGKEIVNVLASLTKKEQKAKQKEIKTHEHEEKAK